MNLILETTISYILSLLRRFWYFSDRHVVMEKWKVNTKVRAILAKLRFIFIYLFVLLVIFLLQNK